MKTPTLNSGYYYWLIFIHLFVVFCSHPMFNDQQNIRPGIISLLEKINDHAGSWFIDFYNLVTPASTQVFFSFVVIFVLVSPLVMQGLHESCVGQNKCPFPSNVCHRILLIEIKHFWRDATKFSRFSFENITAWKKCKRNVLNAYMKNKTFLRNCFCAILLSNFKHICCDDKRQLSTLHNHHFLQIWLTLCFSVLSLHDCNALFFQ